MSAGQITIDSILTQNVLMRENINRAKVIATYKYARRAIRHYEKGGSEFTSEVIGIEAEYWDERAKELELEKSK